MITHCQLPLARSGSLWPWQCIGTLMGRRNPLRNLMLKGRNAKLLVEAAQELGEVVGEAVGELAEAAAREVVAGEEVGEVVTPPTQLRMLKGRNAKLLRQLKL